MKLSVSSVVASLVGAGLCLVGPYSAMVRSQDQPPAKKAVAEQKEDRANWMGVGN